MWTSTLLIIPTRHISLTPSSKSHYVFCTVCTVIFFFFSTIAAYRGQRKFSLQPVGVTVSYAHCFICSHLCFLSSHLWFNHCGMWFSVYTNKITTLRIIWKICLFPPKVWKRPRKWGFGQYWHESFLICEFCTDKGQHKLRKHILLHKQFIHRKKLNFRFIKISTISSYYSSA